ncbi:transposase [Paenibacillus terrae]|uniref:transposase n=1 Tax=Paenibacillus terrae TaxID=159743 RepID=UPI0009E3AB95
MQKKSLKIHVVVDALGNPIHFDLSGDENHDSVQGYDILKQLKLTLKHILADRAYDTIAIRTLLEEEQDHPCDS